MNINNLKISINDIKATYNGIKQLAKQYASKGDYERCLQYITNDCVTIAQQFNWIYSDDELENLLKDISPRIISSEESNYIPVRNRVVLYDDFCVSFILALQYLDALVTAGKEVLYITFDQQSGNFSSILPIIQNKYPDVKVLNLPKKSIIQSNIDLYKEILNFLFNNSSLSFVISTLSKGLE